MSAVLDKPVVDTLEETWLDDEPGCQSATGCSHTAEWNCVMRCCGQSASLCTRCLMQARKVAEARYITCATCGHVHGYANFNQIVRVSPI